MEPEKKSRRTELLFKKEFDSLTPEEEDELLALDEALKKAKTRPLQMSPKTKKMTFG